MGRQALTSKESELARPTPSPQEIPREPPNIPRYSTSGFQKAAQQTPVFGSGSWFFREASPENIPNLSKMNQNNIELCKREASPENIPNLSKMNQNNIELCKTTGFWWVDRPELLKNQNWLGPTPSPQGIPREPPNIPRYSTSGFQKAAQQTPVLRSGSWFFRGASPENIPNLSKMNQKKHRTM